MKKVSYEYTGLEIAVVGMSGRFPGAKNIPELWELLKSGNEGISTFDEEQLRAAGVEEEAIQAPNYMPARGIIDEVDQFDNEFFGYSAREAELLDPQVRIFLECAWEALEDGGYDPATYPKRIGTFAGANPNLYWTFGTYFAGKDDIGDFANKDLLSTRVSYKLNLKGPSYTVFTACSTSLVTIHQACRSILGGECEMALAGGISIELPQESGYFHQEGMILSADGHNRSFDADASGAVFSNGAGVVLLKSLEDALEDGDNIYAVIKGTAVNNDGARKVGYPAPSVKGQAEVIKDALVISEVDPESISYVEAHGSATSIGDPIEMEALQQAYDTDQKGFCGVGSIKSNLGHLNIASGVAGFIKTVLAIKHRAIPPTLHFNAPNPKIDFKNSAFYVVDQLVELKQSEPIRAAVSSFGVGGTNAHAILEEAPKPAQHPHNGPALLRFSADNPNSLRDYQSHLLDYLKETKNELANIAYTLQTGRRAFSERAFLVADATAEAVDLLEHQEEKVFKGNVNPHADKPHVIFMFPGQGAQYVNMGRELYQNVDVFRKEVDLGLTTIQQLTGRNVRQIWFRESFDPSQDYFGNPLNHTENTQPLLFVFEYALCRTLMSYGVTPDAMIGHSFGEFVAACISGVFSFEDALRLVIKRGELIAALPQGEGTMMSIAISEIELMKYLPETLDIAAVNSQQSCVVSGDTKEVHRLKEALEPKGYSCRLLRISQAFHSRMMEPILEEFMAEVRKAKINDLTIPFMSNLNGKWADNATIQSPQYWSDHLRYAVRFEDGLQELVKKPNAVLIEIGPGTTLSTFVNQSKQESSDYHAINLVRHPKDEASDEKYLLEKIGMLWLKGVDLDWNQYYSPQKRHSVSVPTYAFNRKSFWLDEEGFRKKREILENGVAEPSAKSNLYKPQWVIDQAQSSTDGKGSTHAIFLLDQGNVGAGVAAQLKGGYQSFTSIDHVQDLKSDTWSEMLDSIPEGEPLEIGLFHTLDKVPEDIASPTLIENKTYGPLLESVHARGIPARFIWFTTGTVTGGEGHATAQLVQAHYPKFSIQCMVIDPKDYQHAGSARKHHKLLAGEFQVAELQTYVAIKAATRQVWKPFVPFTEVALPENATTADTLVAGYISDETIRTITHMHAKGRVQVVPDPSFPAQGEWDSWASGSLSDEQKTQYLIETSGLSDRSPVNLQDWMGRVRTEHGFVYDTIEEDLLQLTQRLGTALIYRYWSEAGIEMKEGMSTTKEDLKSQLRLLPKFNKFFDYFVHELEQDGVLETSGDQIQFLDQLNAEGIIKEVKKAIEEQYQDCLPIYDLVMHCASNYQKALSGEVSAVGGLFPDGKSDLLDSVAGNAVFTSSSKTYTHRLVEVIRQYIADAGERTIRILEVGAGRGELTKSVLPALQGAAIEYDFTDIGQTFVKEAEEKWSQTYDFMSFRTFDACAEPEPQGFDLHGYDLVIALDIVHATPSLSHTIKNLQQLLKPEGWMGFIENTSSLRLVNLVWGLADGWWDFTDLDIRTHTPLIPSGQWLDLMQRLDFDTVAAFNDQTVVEVEPDHELLLMQARPATTWTAYQKYLLHQGQGQLDQVQHQVATLKQLAHDGAVKVISGDLTSVALSESGIDKPEAHASLVYFSNPKADPMVLVKSLDQLQEDVETLGLERAVVVTDASHYLSPSVSSVPIAQQSTIEKALADYHLSSQAFWTHLSIAHSSSGLSEEWKAKLLLSDAAFAGIWDQVLSGTLTGELVVSGTHPEWITLSSESASTEERDENMDVSELPQTKTESIISSIWGEVFGINPIKRSDHYFDLGGDSLMMVAVIAKMEKLLEVKVKVKEFYAHPTVSALARLIESRQKGPRLVIAKSPEQDSYLATPAQKTMFYLQFLHLESTSYNITQVMELSKSVDENKLIAALNKLIERHETLRTHFLLEEGELRQVVMTQYKLDVQRIQVESGQLHGEIDAFIRPFNLLEEPTFRAGILQEQGTRYLIIDLHHILCDGISIDILKRELSALYHGDRLEPLELQYKDYSEWQGTQEYENHLQLQKTYWFDQFAVEPPTLSLPYDSKKEKYTNPAGEHYVSDIDGKLFDSIKKQLKVSNTTLFAQLMAATYIVVAKYADLEDLVVGTGTVGRNFSGLSDVIGNFVNTVPIRALPVGHKPYQTFLNEVQQQVNDALEHQDYPYEDLITKLPFNQGKDQKALFDVAVTLVSSSLVNQTEKDEVRLFERYVDHFDHTSKFDIDVNAVEKQDRITLVIEYASLLFKEQTIASFVSHLKEVLTQAMERPDTLLENISLTDLEAMRGKMAQPTAHQQQIKDNFFDLKY